MFLQKLMKMSLLTELKLICYGCSARSLWLLSVRAQVFVTDCSLSARCRPRIQLALVLSGLLLLLCD